MEKNKNQTHKQAYWYKNNFLVLLQEAYMNCISLQVQEKALGIDIL